jgi:hypothetical protein
MARELHRPACGVSRECAAGDAVICAYYSEDDEDFVQTAAHASSALGSPKREGDSVRFADGWNDQPGPSYVQFWSMKPVAYKLRSNEDVGGLLGYLSNE